MFPPLLTHTITLTLDHIPFPTPRTHLSPRSQPRTIILLHLHTYLHIARISWHSSLPFIISHLRQLTTEEPRFRRQTSNSLHSVQLLLYLSCPSRMSVSVAASFRTFDLTWRWPTTSFNFIAPCRPSSTTKNNLSKLRIKCSPKSQPVLCFYENGDSFIIISVYYLLCHIGSLVDVACLQLILLC